MSVELRSYLGQFLQQKGVTLGAEDESSFPMRAIWEPWNASTNRNAQPILRETVLEHAAHSSDLSFGSERPNPIAGSRQSTPNKALVFDSMPSAACST